MIYEYDDQMGIISIYSNLKFYKFFAFRVLASKAAGCSSSETACGGNREKERDRARHWTKTEPEQKTQPQLGPRAGLLRGETGKRPREKATV